jgi:small-conductance mechanosensitive channel
LPEPSKAGAGIIKPDIYTKTVEMRRLILPILVFLTGNVLRFTPGYLDLSDTQMNYGLQKTGEVLIVVAFTWGIIALFRMAKLQLLKRQDVTQSDNLRSRKLVTQINILEKILVFIIVIIALATSLMLFDGVRNIGVSIFASAGIAGIILGLSAQKALGTLLAGLQIAITQPINTDDVVIVENEWGWIEEINLTYVVVRIWDQRRLIVPSTYFLEKPFQNWTRTSADILGTVFIYTDYTMPVEPLRQELTRLLQESPLWDGRVNVLQVTDAKEYTLELRALMSASSSPKAWDLRVYVREKLIGFIQREYPECLPRTRVSLEDSLKRAEAVATARIAPAG